MTDDERDEQDEAATLRAMHESARRSIARAVRAARRGVGVEGGRRLSRSEDVDVMMIHDDVDDWEAVNAVEHRADACRRSADAHRRNREWLVKRDERGTIVVHRNALHYSDGM